MQVKHSIYISTLYEYEFEFNYVVSLLMFYANRFIIESTFDCDQVNNFAKCEQTLAVWIDMKMSHEQYKYKLTL
jgi:hypothetical protein